MQHRERAERGTAKDEHQRHASGPPMAAATAPAKSGPTSWPIGRPAPSMANTCGAGPDRVAVGDQRQASGSRPPTPMPVPVSATPIRNALAKTDEGRARGEDEGAGADDAVPDPVAERGRRDS